MTKMKKIENTNPYTKKKIQLVVGAYLAILTLEVLFVWLAVTFSIVGWSVAATIWSIVTLVVLAVGGFQLYEHLDEQERHYHRVSD